MPGIHLARIGRLLCHGGATLGFLGLLGWVTRTAYLTTIVSGQPPMMPNTAVGLLLLGIAGVLRHREHVGQWRTVVTIVAALVVLVIGIGTLVEYWLTVDLHLDQLLFRSHEGPYPGRPSPLTAQAFVLLSVALLVLDTRPTASMRPSEWLIVAAGLIAFVSLTGMVFGTGEVYRLAGDPVIGVSPPTAVSLLLLSIGLLLERPTTGVMHVVTSPGPGGVLLRRLAPPTLLAPVLLGLVVVRLWGVHDADQAVLPFAVLSSMTAVGGLVLVAITAIPLNRAHEALELARRRARALVEEAADGIFVVDVDGRCTDINSAGCRMLEYARSEVVGKNFDELVAPEDTARPWRSKEQLERGDARITECSLLCKGGSRVPVEVNAKVLPDGRWQGLVRDISARKRLEQELRRAKERLELALAGANLGAWDWNVETGEVVFNERWFAMRGLSPGEVESNVDSWRLGIHPDDWPRVQTVLADHFEGRIDSYSVECRVRTKSGSWIWTLDRGRVFERDQTGRPTRMAGTELDITERKQIEQALRVSEHQEKFLAEVGAVLSSTLGYEETSDNIASLAVAELADICIVETEDEDGALRRWSVAHRDPSKAELAAALQRTPLDPRRPHFGSAVFDIRRPYAMDEVTPAYLEAIAQSDELLRVWRELEPKSFLALPLVAHGRLAGAMILVSTTTRRDSPANRRLADEVARRAAYAVENARLYRAARRAIQARDDVLGIVAHDLRNPLNIVRMQALLLREQGLRSKHGAPQAVAMLERAVARMDRLIQDLLDVTAMEANRLSIEPTHVSPDHVVSIAVEAQCMLAASASLELRAEVAGDLPELWADRDRLLQVLENLLGNAIKFTPPGGRITVGAAPKDGEVLLWVADTGVGIAAEDLPRLFDRFWQAPRERRRGAGLGLPIVKGIIEAHGGRVWVQSTPRQGSTVFFVIPTTPREPLAAKRRART